MSRTFKTDPYWVKIKNPERVGAETYAVHNHEKGECDLPAEPEWDTNLHGNCWWQIDCLGKNIFCGCNLCTDRNYHVRENRANRHKSNQRRSGRNVSLDYYDDEFDDFDVTGWSW